jgi:hypothetical protein
VISCGINDSTEWRKATFRYGGHFEVMTDQKNSITRARLSQYPSYSESQVGPKISRGFKFYQFVPIPKIGF